MDRKNFIIFGGTGFLGGVIKDQFTKRQGFKVEAPSRKELDLLNLQQTIDFVAQQPSGSVFINCAAVVGSVHTGMEREMALVEENTRINLNIFTALSNYKNTFYLINFLSNCIYPHQVELQTEDLLYEGSPHFTARAYAHTKRHALQMFDILNSKENAHIQQLILPGLFGAGNHLDEKRLHAFDGIIVRMLKAQADGENYFEVYGTGSPVREWVPVSEVAIATRLVAESEFNAPSVLNFSIGFHESIWETTKRIKRLIGYSGELVRNENYVDGAPVKILSNDLFKKSYTSYKNNNDVDTETLKGINYYKKKM